MSATPIKSTFLKRLWLADALWLLALSGYLLAGVQLLPFHPDETEHLYASNDYATLFIDRNPAALAPVRDSMGQLANKLSALRLSDGPFLSYLLGLSWHVAGITRESLPPEPGWDWNADFETNVAQGRRPDDRLLNAARYATTLTLCTSVVALFALTRQFEGRLLAYGATLLYVLNPMLLLHTRRAMFEAPLLCFGLLALLFAALIVRRRAAGERPPRGYWIGLAAAGGFALAAKHTGIAYLGAALGWIFVGDLLLLAREQGRNLARAVASRAAALVGVGALSLALFFLLSPVFWDDPAHEITTLLNLRAYTLQTQIAANPNGEPLALPERLKNAATYPFIQYPQFEFVNNTSVQEYWRYMTSPYSGAHPGTTVGAAGMFLTAAGIATAFYRLLRGSAGQRAQYAGLFVWLLAMLALTLASPLGWERYYLPLIPVYALLVALGLLGLAKFVVYRLTA